MKLSDLAIITESFDRVGKRWLNEEELKKFATNTLEHEALNLKERTKLYQEKEIDEKDINVFDFYSDGYRTGVFIYLSDDNTLTAGYDTNNQPVKAKQLYKKEKGELLYDDDGNAIPTGRILMRFKSRRGGMGVFISNSLFEEIEKDKYYVFVGSLQTQYKNLDTNKYVKNRTEDGNYSDPSFTLNIWQLASIVKKGQSIAIVMPKANFEQQKG
jgi:hypothetical protein